MAHWFHRNPLKPSRETKFDLKKVLSTDPAYRICNELRLRRQKLLEHLESASSDLTMVEGEFRQYLALLDGLVFEIGEPKRADEATNGAAGAGDSEEDGERRLKNSKLRYLIRFTWGMSMLGTESM